MYPVKHTQIALENEEARKSGMDYDQFEELAWLAVSETSQGVSSGAAASFLHAQLLV